MEGTRRYSFQPPKNAGRAAHAVHFLSALYTWDEAQGVYETPARQYDPTLGRFLSVDPQRQDASPYVYAGNNPVLYKDPNGRGRFGTVVTSQVKAKAKELVAETFAFDSGSRVFSKIGDPAVQGFFDSFELLYVSDRHVYEHFADRIGEAKGANTSSLKSIFDRLYEAAPDLPKVNVEQMADVASNMKEHHSVVHRFFNYEERWRKVVAEEFHGNEDAFFRSSRLEDVMRDTTGSAPGAKIGYSNCGHIADCLGNTIAEMDPELNVEIFAAGKNEEGAEIDHDFVVVGRDPKTDPSKPMTWNDQALIVDGWHGFVEQANQVYTQGIKPEFYNQDFKPEISFAFE